MRHATEEASLKKHNAMAALLAALMTVSAVGLSGCSLKVPLPSSLEDTPVDTINTEPGTNAAGEALVVEGTFGTGGGWYLTEDGTLCIEGAESFAAGSRTDVPWYRYRDEIKRLELGEGLKSINHYAFYGETELEEVVLPKSLESIGLYAFEGCESLTTVSFPEGLKEVGFWAFAGCTGLTTAQFGESMTVIGSYAFEDCTELKSAVFYGDVTDVAYGCFDGCENLKTLCLPDSVETISDNALKDCESLKEIFFAGSQSDWEAIDVGNNESQLMGVKVYCGSDYANLRSIDYEDVFMILPEAEEEIEVNFSDTLTMVYNEAEDNVFTPGGFESGDICVLRSEKTAAEMQLYLASYDCLLFPAEYNLDNTPYDVVIDLSSYCESGVNLADLLEEAAEESGSYTLRSSATSATATVEAFAEKMLKSLPFYDPENPEAGYTQLDNLDTGKLTFIGFEDEDGSRYYFTICDGKAVSVTLELFAAKSSSEGQTYVKRWLAALDPAPEAQISRAK